MINFINYGIKIKYIKCREKLDKNEVENEERRENLKKVKGRMSYGW